MKTIPIRQFQRYPNKYLKELPLTLTKYGEAVAQVIPVRALPIKEEKQLPVIIKPKMAKLPMPELNEGMALLQQILDHPPTQAGFNRFALKRLIAKKGKIRVFKAIRWALNLRSEPFAPVITDYLSLERKWDQLEAFAARQTNKSTVLDATNLGGQNASEI